MADKRVIKKYVVVQYDDHNVLVGFVDTARVETRGTIKEYITKEGLLKSFPEFEDELIDEKPI